MEKLLAVFDTDFLYASRLMEYLKKTDRDIFEVLLFTKRESLVDFLKYQSVDILLYGEEALFEELPKENIKYLFLLSADKKHVKNKLEIIYKYQAAGRIASDILSCYTRLEDNNQNHVIGNVSFIAVFTPVPGAEKRCYAWSLAKELSYKRKVLFIALEQLPTLSLLGQEDSGQSMSELLYYLKESESNYMDKLKSYLAYSEKLSYLSGPTHGFDLLSLSKEDIAKFMDDIRKHSDYEMVVLYLEIYTEGSMEALRLSNEVCLATCSSPYEELIVKEWERQMELIGVPISKLRMNRIRLPTAEQLVGDNPISEDIYTAIRPFATELAAQI